MKRSFIFFAATFLSAFLFVSAAEAQTYLLKGTLFDPTNYPATYPNAQVAILCNTTLITTINAQPDATWSYYAPACSGNYYIRINNNPNLTFRWFSNYEGSYNVKDFGALGNGVNDDTIAIRDAIYFIASLNGGKLLFPAGGYNTTGGFTLPRGITIEGTNGIAVSSCRITLTSSTHLFKIGENTDGVSLKKILLTTNATATTPYYLSNSVAILAQGAASSAGTSSIGLAFRDMTIQGFQRGIYVNGTDAKKEWQLETVRLDHVQILQNKTSIELNTYNTDWQISNSLIGAVQNGIGLDIKYAGAILIENSFGWGAGPSHEIGTSNVSETFIHIGGPHAVIKIDNTQCEKFRNFMVVDQRDPNGQPYDDYVNPVMVANSVIGDRIIFKSNVVFVSTANFYLSDSVQAWVAGQPLRFNDGTSYTLYSQRSFSDPQNCSVPNQSCCSAGTAVPPVTEGGANNVKIYSTGDSFSPFNRYYCQNPAGTPSDFIVSGNTFVNGIGSVNNLGKSKITFGDNVGVGSNNPGSGYDQSIYRILEVEGKDGRAPALFLNRTGGALGTVNRRWAWMVWQDGNLYLQDVGVANRLIIDTNGNLLPADDNMGQIGTDGRRWNRVRANVIQPGDIILTDSATGKELYRIREDEKNIYFSDERTGKEMMRIDRRGNLFIKGKIYTGGKITKPRLKTINKSANKSKKKKRK